MPADSYCTVAKSMMESMGWKEGDGLGKERQGRTNALKPRKKIDNAGLGSKRTTGKWLDACCAYDDILSKLNVVYDGNKNETEATEEKEETPEERKERKRLKKEEKKRKREMEAENVQESDEAPKKKKKSKKSKKVVEETAEEKSEAESEDEKPVRPVLARHLIYAKRLRAKQVDGYSADHKAEIFASIQRQVRSEQLRKDRYAIPARPAPVEESEDESEPETTPTPTPTQAARREVVGFTEDTQVNIYNAAMDKQIKGRTGLGVAKKLSKSKRREAAISSNHLTRIGQYLARTFVSAGNLNEVHRKL